GQFPGEHRLGERRRALVGWLGGFGHQPIEPPTTPFRWLTHPGELRPRSGQSPIVTQVRSSTVQATIPAQPDPPAAPRRSWAAAIAAMRGGLPDRALWSHLAWQAIRQRYRRPVLGPLWITLAMGVAAIGLGLLYSQLFGAAIGAFLPYLTVGFIVWNFVIGWM